MRRNENQPRPTAGCLSVPLFNQRKRSRLPLTSNPSENDMCSGNSLGYVSASTSRAPLTQRSEWNQQTNLRPEQGKAWPSTSFHSTGHGYAPMPHPHKPTYDRSQTVMQRQSGRQDSAAVTQICRMNAYPGVSGANQTQQRPSSGKQPMKQQVFSKQTNPPKASFTFQKPLPFPSLSQRPGLQSQNTEWNVKSVGHTGAGIWVEDTFGTSRSESKVKQEPKKSTETKPGPEDSLRILTAVIEGMKHWSQFKDKVPMLFEIFATLDSAVTVGKYGAKNFLMRDGNDVVPCVYYETDKVLPRLIRGQMHRCVGNYDRCKNILTCVSVRPASSSEQRNAKEAVKASDAEMRNMVQVLTEM